MNTIQRTARALRSSIRSLPSFSGRTRTSRDVRVLNSSLYSERGIVENPSIVANGRELASRHAESIHSGERDFVSSLLVDNFPSHTTTQLNTAPQVNTTPQNPVHAEEGELVSSIFADNLPLNTTDKEMDDLDKEHEQVKHRIQIWILCLNLGLSILHNQPSVQLKHADEMLAAIDKIFVKRREAIHKARAEQKQKIENTIVGNPIDSTNTSS